jgi:hypothetical protein
MFSRSWRAGKLVLALLELARTFAGQTDRLLINSFYELEEYRCTRVYPPSLPSLVSIQTPIPLTPLQIVHEGSATEVCANEIVMGLNANHRTICKYAAKTEVFNAVVLQMQTRIVEIQRATGTGKKAERISDESSGESASLADIGERWGR